MREKEREEGRKGWRGEREREIEIDIKAVGRNRESQRKGKRGKLAGIMPINFHFKVFDWT